LHILKALAISLGVWNKPDLACAARKCDRLLGKLIYRHLGVAADIDDLAETRRRLKRLYDAFDNVRHVAKAPRLCPVAVHIERLISQCRLHKPRHDHPVLPCLSRPDGVEKPCDNDGQTRFLVVSESEEFVERFCTGVCPAVFVGRAGQQIVFFPERDRDALAVNLARRGNEDAFAVFRTTAKHDIGAVKIVSIVLTGCSMISRTPTALAM
jgi:hypothetical protein